MLETFIALYYNIFGIYGGALFGILMGLLSFFFFIILFFILLKVPKSVLKLFILSLKPNEVIVFHKPTNMLLKGKIIDEMLSFNINGIEYAMFLHKKPYETLYGRPFIEVYTNELLGCDTAILLDLENIKENIPEDIQKKYANAVIQKNKLETELLTNDRLTAEDKKLINEAIAAYDGYILKVENKYGIAHRKVDKNQIICWKVDWTKIKDYLIGGSLSQLHNLAKSYGIAVAKMEKVNWEKIALFIFIGIIGLGVLYMIVNGQGNGHEANAATSMAKTVVVSNMTK